MNDNVVKIMNAECPGKCLQYMITGGEGVFSTLFKMSFRKCIPEQSDCSVKLLDKFDPANAEKGNLVDCDDSQAALVSTLTGELRFEKCKMLSWKDGRKQRNHRSCIPNGLWTTCCFG